MDGVEEREREGFVVSYATVEDVLRIGFLGRIIIRVTEGIGTVSQGYSGIVA